MKRSHSRILPKNIVYRTEILQISSYETCEKCLQSLYPSLSLLHHEVAEALSGIYAQYLGVLSKRISFRMAQKSGDVLGPFSAYNGALNKEELSQKVRELSRVDHLLSIYYLFHDKVQKFMEDIHRELGKLSSEESLQMICLFDAYCIVKLSIAELSKVTRGLFDRKHTITCEYITKLEFTRRVLNPLENKLTLLKELLVDETVIKEIYQLKYEFSAFSPAKQACEDGESAEINKMGIDEVVDYIEGKSPLKEKKKRNKGAKLGSEIDKEVEEFKKKLKLVKSSARLKPKLSEEWMNKLKSLIS